MKKITPLVRYIKFSFCFLESDNDKEETVNIDANNIKSSSGGSSVGGSCSRLEKEEEDLVSEYEYHEEQGDCQVQRYSVVKHVGAPPPPRAAYAPRPIESGSPVCRKRNTVRSD